MNRTPARLPRLLALLAVVLLAVVLCLPTPPAAAEIERIEDFHSEIRIEADGSLTVTETISVIGGVRIGSGFTREITSRPGMREQQYAVRNIQVLSVQRDGVDEKWTTSEIRGGVGIDVGPGATAPLPGRHKYVLRYRIENQIGLFDRQEQLIWNATGGAWPVPVERARVRVTLPGDAKPRGMAGYTGRPEERGSDYSTRIDFEKRAAFSTTRPLAPGEQLTVIVSWPRQEKPKREAEPEPENLPVYLRPEGRVNEYRSVIRIQPNGALEVTETIKLTIDRKWRTERFFRPFPDLTEHGDGARFGLSLAVLDAWENGRSVKWSTTRKYGLKVTFNTYRPRGEVTYSLRYITNPQVRFGDENDRLVWDVMYYAWAMPVDKVSVTVVLPDGAEAVVARAHARSDSDDSSAFETEGVSEHVLELRSVRPLKIREGMAVTVSWPRGYVERPPTRYDDDGEPIENPMWTFRGNPSLKTGLWGLGLLAVFYVAVWILRGRDPEVGAVTVDSEPPGGLCPAAVRYVINMGADYRMLAAAIVSLAAKGRLAIRKTGFDEFAVTKCGAATGLPDSESAVQQVLFPDDGAEDLEIVPRNRNRIEAAQARLLSALSAGQAGKSFLHNEEFTVLGVVATTGIVIVMIGQSPGGGNGIFVVALGLVIAYAAYRKGRKIYDSMLRPMSDPPEGRVVSFLFRYRGNFFYSGLIALLSLKWLGSSGLAVIVGLVALNILFAELLKAPTRPGRRLMNAIEGFEAWLLGDESARHVSFTPTRELFERYLPFAVALEVEKDWARRFGDAGPEGMGHDEGRPHWYEGFLPASLWHVRLAGHLGADLTAALESACYTEPRETARK